jgi:hypothetical protein
MLWTGICVHPYTCMPVQVGGGFLGSRPEPVWCCNVMVEAQTPHGVHSTSIRNVYKVFGTLICQGLTYGSPLTLLCLWRSGQRSAGLDCQGFGVDNKRARVMLWWHGWGSNPLWNAFHIHMIRIQSVLASLYAGDSHVGSPLQWYISAGLGWDFEMTGVDPTPCNVLQQASDWITNPYWMYTKCFGTLLCWVWAYGTTLTLFRICRSGVDLGFWG